MKFFLLCICLAIVADLTLARSKYRYARQADLLEERYSFEGPDRRQFGQRPFRQFGPNQGQFGQQRPFGHFGQGQFGPGQFDQFGQGQFGQRPFGQEQGQFGQRPFGQGQGQFGQGQGQFGQGQGQFGQGQGQFSQGQGQFGQAQGQSGQAQGDFVQGQLGQGQFGQGQFGQGQNGQGQFGQGQTGQGQNNQRGQVGGSTTQSNSVRECIRSCPVTAEYNPVCGTDNTTYSNPGRLTCAQNCGVDVTLFRSSPCPVTVAPPTASSTSSSTLPDTFNPADLGSNAGIDTGDQSQTDPNLESVFGAPVTDASSLQTQP